MQATSGGTYMNTQVFPLPPMSGVLHANIGPLNLAQGHYTLEVRLGELPGNIIDAWDNVDTIMIPECIPKHGALNFDSRRGVVYIPAHYQDAKQWHVKQDSN
jgi:hypothetical protein